MELATPTSTLSVGVIVQHPGVAALLAAPLRDLALVAPQRALQIDVSVRTAQLQDTVPIELRCVLFPVDVLLNPLGRKVGVVGHTHGRGRIHHRGHGECRSSARS
jgi:hypothetical protein